MPLKESETSGTGPSHRADNHTPKGCHGDLWVKVQVSVQEDDKSSGVQIDRPACRWPVWMLEW